ncbi:unnamed protein product [Diabrotica balteata]|uniref:Pre-C2HC domain-containing protein n=1 Tax=Diabrotica balteata TaxID=107213 RepID=A0A9N9TBL1_DIABA|nr:unnamed protein product [Diabrotica balteata]
MGLLSWIAVKGADVQEVGFNHEELGHSVKNISNIKRIKDKKQLPLFHVELVANANNKDIYKVNKLLNSIVEVEPPHPKREITNIATECHDT